MRDHSFKRYSIAWLPEKWHEQISLEESKNLPLVTIGILSFNRKNELRATLDVLTRGIDYPYIEVIVVDNASQDGSQEMVLREYPAVRLCSLKTNEGVVGRNYYFRLAKGEFIFSFDDDSFPATPSTILRAVLLLQSDTAIDIASFLYYQPKTDYYETQGLESFYIKKVNNAMYEGVYFVEGGMCFRASALTNGVGYDERFFWGAEGADLSLQLFSRGCKGVYVNDIATLHLKSAIRSKPTKQSFLFTRNYVWTIFKHFHVIIASVLFILYVFRKLIASILHPSLAHGILKGIWRGIIGAMPFILAKPKLTISQTLRLGRWYLFLYRW